LPLQFLPFFGASLAPDRFGKRRPSRFFILFWILPALNAITRIRRWALGSVDLADDLRGDAVRLSFIRIVRRADGQCGLNKWSVRARPGLSCDQALYGAVAVGVLQSQYVTWIERHRPRRGNFPVDDGQLVCPLWKRIKLRIGRPV